MKARRLRVLIIDDTKEVLETLKANLDQPVEVDGLTTAIEITTVHVQMELGSDGTSYQITESTIRQLAQACAEKFDYIISDFAFIGDHLRNEALRLQLLKDKRGVRREDLEGFVLHLRDVKRRFESMLQSKALDRDDETNITRHFLSHNGPILVYTNSPDPFSSYFENYVIRVRKNEVRDVFMACQNVDFLLAHDEFSITVEIAALFTPEGRKLYYSKLLGRRIDAELKMIALARMVKSQHKLRVINTRSAFTYLTRLGLAFGALTALFGEILFHWLHEVVDMIMHKLGYDLDKSLIAHLLALVALIVIAASVFSWLGVVMATKLEKRVEKLLEND